MLSIFKILTRQAKRPEASADGVVLPTEQGGPPTAQKEDNVSSVAPDAIIKPDTANLNLISQARKLEQLRHYIEDARNFTPQLEKALEDLETHTLNIQSTLQEQKVTFESLPELIELAREEALELHEQKKELLEQLSAQGQDAADQYTNIATTDKLLSPCAAEFNDTTKKSTLTYDSSPLLDSRPIFESSNIATTDDKVKKLLRKALEHQDTIEKYAAQYQETEALYDQTSIEYDKLFAHNAKLDAHLNKLFRLKDTLENETVSLQHALQAGQQADIQAVRTYPPLSEIQEWAADHLSDRVVILPSAFKKAAGSTYQNPEHVYQALELLDGPYWEQKTNGTDEVRAAFKEQLDQQYLSIGKSLTAASSKLIESSYTKIYNGESHYLDSHIGRGNTRDERRCMRLYFTWLSDTQQVLVGHMPSHLPTLDG